MAVATDTILRKMQRELTEAQKLSVDETAMKKHVVKIQLLCELLTDEQSAPGSEHQMTDRELKAMMGDEAAKQQQPEPVHGSIDHDDANGKSLFDF
ncbi:MAG TPA: YwdI family protein [Lentibacillus sp.]|uniref:YwdI family protein n=1 Tax=Lentibacillus sp. TaxID=1925746 RepID=UPI002B4B07C2|nr:YwdI family protein [Lentibacillus sp.]HLR62856.1 YwdI family protein [Lentibacillus sp.]